MSKRDPRVGLLKILIAAAWADGELSAEEQETIRKIERDLDLPESEQVALDRLFEEPLGLEEAEEMARDLIPSLSAEERDDWMRRIDRVVRSDAEVDPRERRLLEGLEEAIREADAGPSLLARIRGLFRSDRAAKPERTESGVVRKILQRMPAEAKSRERGGDRFEYATLFGALLYRVAFADGAFTDDEAARLRTLLTGTFAFDEDESQRIVDVIESKAAEDLDRQRLCATFNRVTDMEGRMRLLGCLFIVSEADGEISDAELREMRLIANYLWIGAREFHRVRTRYGPDESRDAD
ncbi:MAG: hypothetical protein GF346_00885 [Candidatus Eisenbacteria bacterium]|nr:hypothetical protein [Candidatus Latescibacterota bacterium]MBD3300987.1 hypothetical protein [Candidatus Eisenbacteria bacterium]